jgi:hypothetical protein
LKLGEHFLFLRSPVKVVRSRPLIQEVEHAFATLWSMIVVAYKKFKWSRRPNLEKVSWSFVFRQCWIGRVQFCGRKIVLTSERLSDSIVIRERTIRLDCVVKSCAEIWEQMRTFVLAHRILLRRYSIS